MSEQGEEMLAGAGVSGVQDVSAHHDQHLADGELAPMARVLVDTSAVYTLLDRTDANHAAAREALADRQFVEVFSDAVRGRHVYSPSPSGVS